jgi:hypothetical protein
MKELAQRLAVVIIGYACQQALPQSPPDWRGTAKVMDENGQPVPGANVEISYRVQSPPGQGEPWQKISGTSDTNGIFAASHSYTSIFLSFQASKAGYYSAWCGYELPFEYKSEKWNPTITLALKKVVHPIPMSAALVSYFMPTNSNPVGLDLATGGWVAPHGTGASTDIIFATHFDKRSEADYDYKLVVSFPNKGDGIQGFEATTQSGLRSPREAPENGYEPDLVKVDSVRPGQTAKYIWDEKTNYFFRVRTVLDEKGAVKSALYGKIYGDFNRFHYYLNPTPNDRNVEFDPKRNLLKGEQVFAP